MPQPRQARQPKPSPTEIVTIKMSPQAADILRQVLAQQNVQVGAENFINTSVRLGEALAAITAGLQTFVESQQATPE